MTGVATTGRDLRLRLRERVALADRVLDPAFGARQAERWVEEHRPGARVVRSRTHTALCRGQDDVSVRVSAELAADTAPLTEVTLLVRARGDEVSTTAFPQDPELPTLPTMVDPVAASHVLAAAVPELADPAAVGHGATWGVRLVHHPRGGACVLRYDAPHSADAAVRVYAKVHPHRDVAEAAATALTAGPGAVLRSGSLTLGLPRLLGVALDQHTVFLESLGDPVTPPVRPDEAGRVLGLLHARAATGLLPRVSPSDEVRQVEEELVSAGALWPDLAGLLEPHVRRAALLLGRSTAETPVLSHGDFTPSQLLRLPHGLGLLDLDTLRLADPSSDLGRYLAYLELTLARHGTAPGLGRRAFLAAYRQTAGDPSVVAAERVEGFRTLHLTHHALRAARRFKEHRVHRALGVLDHRTEGGRHDHDDV